MLTFFDTYDLTIEANGIRRLDSYNSFITLLECSTTSGVKVAIGGGGPKGVLKKGLSVQLPQGKTFDYIIFENTTAAQITITVALSTGIVYDNRLVLAGVVPTDNTANKIETPAKIALNAGNSYTATIAADSDRKELIIQNTGANDFWYGDTNVDPANKRGIKVQPNDSHVLTLTAAVTLKSNSVDCDISVAYLSKV
ncbi:MAG TPA: hypothetical protein VMW16_08690 [Sedimentisphaerales bacterium]|nr:hypothetical protein [Sedimentisphaerales bacterium]